MGYSNDLDWKLMPVSKEEFFEELKKDKSKRIFFNEKQIESITDFMNKIGIRFNKPVHSF